MPLSLSAGKGLFLWAPVVGYTGFIFWLSSSYRPLPGIEIFPQIDKVYHLLEYIPLGLFWLRALHRSQPQAAGRKNRVFITAFLAGLLTAVLDEWYQGAVPMKETSFFDGVADAAGALLGEWLYLKRAITP